MRKAKWIRLLLLTLLVATAVADVVAMPTYAFERIFFTDAEHTVVCGTTRVYCWGTFREGCVTPYYVDEFMTLCLDDPIDPRPCPEDPFCF